VVLDSQSLMPSVAKTLPKVSSY